MSKINLSKDGLVDLARCVFQTMQCEWEGCTISLNCWNTLAKHLYRHCTLVVQEDRFYTCSYSRCSGRLHNSSEALKTHVELSHLSRVALQCPARDCKEVFVRVQQLQSHFEHAHRDLLDRRVSTDALAPLAILAPPRHLRLPPPILNQKIRTDRLLNCISLPPLRRGNSQESASQVISRRWSRLNVQDDEEVDSDPIALDDFPIPQPLAQGVTEPEPVEVKVWKRPSPCRLSHLSCPRPVNRPVRFNSPEQGILYPAFVRMVDKLVASGSLAGHKELGGEKEK